MKAARIATFLLACAIAASVAGGTAAMGNSKKPVFNTRYDCAKAASAKLLNPFLASWGGAVAIKGKSNKYTYAGGGSSGCGLVHANGPFAGQFAGNVIIEYGTRAATAYKGDEKTAKHNGAQACAAHPNTSGDPRVCGPVQVSGIGNHAYEAFFYIATLKGKVFVQLQVGNGVANGQWVPSSTLPPASMLEGATKAILAKLP